MATWKRILVEGDVEGVNGNPVVVTTGTPVTISLGDPDSAQGGGVLGSLSSATVDAANDVALVWDEDASVWKQMPVDQFIVNMAYDELVISESRFHTLNYGNRWVIADEVDNQILSVTAGEAGSPLDNGVIAGSWLKTKWLRIPDSSSPVKEVAFVAPTGNYTNNQTYKLPTDYPSSNGRVLSSTTTGVLSWTSNGGGGSDTNLGSDDLTQDVSATYRSYNIGDSGGVLPRGLLIEGGEAGNEIEVAKFSVTGSNLGASAFAGSVEVRNDGAGKGNFQFYELAFYGEQYVQLEAPNSLANNYTLTLPTTAGSASQVLQTNGSGVLSWADQTDTSGFVDTSGTPANNQIAFFSDSDTIEGDSKFLWDGSKVVSRGGFQYVPENGNKTGELYDCVDGVYEVTPYVSSGDRITFPKVGAVTQALIYTMNAAGGPEAVNVSSSSTNYDKLLGIAPVTGTTEIFYKRCMYTIRKPQNGGTFAYGGALYLDPSNNGNFTATQPTASGVYQRIIGHMVNTSTIVGIEYWTIWFDPSHETIKLV